MWRWIRLGSRFEMCLAGRLGNWLLTVELCQFGVLLRVAINSMPYRSTYTLKGNFHPPQLHTVRR